MSLAWGKLYLRCMLCRVLSGFAIVVGLTFAQALRWDAALGESIRDVVVLPESDLLVSTARSVQVISGETGQPLWHCQECQNISAPSWRPISPVSPYLYESKPLQVEVREERQGPIPAGAPNPSAMDSWSLLMPQNYLILHTKTGKVLYSSRENRQLSLVVSRVFVPEANVLLLMGQGPKNPQKKFSNHVPVVVAYDVETGAELFRQEAFKSSAGERLVPVAMISDGERVFYMSDRRLYAIHPRTGQMLWQTDIFQWFAMEVRPRLFLDRERQQVLVFAQARLCAYQIASGAPAWSKPLKIPRQEILALFTMPDGILVFTDDRQSPDDPGQGGRGLLVRPLAFLVDPATGENRWGERLRVPGLFVGYVPLDGSRILPLFARERFFAPRDAAWTPDKDWELTFDVLDVQQGRWLFKNPISLRGGLLSAARIPGGILVQTTQSIRAYDEEGSPLWERRVRRPMSLPFYLAEEGTEIRAFFVDETGQIFVWRGPGTQPESFGKPLPSFTGRDEPQGLLYQNKRLHIWGTSSLYVLDERGQVIQSFVREAPGFSPPVRVLGMALSVGGTAARWILSRRVAWLRSPEDQLPEAVQLRRALENNSLYAPDLKQARSLGDILFLFGRDGEQVKAYAVRLSDATMVFEKNVGPYTAFGSLKDVVIDPERQRFYLIAQSRIQAY